MVRKIVMVVSIACLCSGCAISKDKAIEIAKREINRRNLPLPKRCVVEIHEQRSYDNDPSPDYWIVGFERPEDEKPLYVIWLREFGGHIEGFTDNTQRLSGGKPKT